MKYEIIGEPMPVVVCDLEANEAMITERGSMVWMSQHEDGNRSRRYWQSLRPHVLR